MVIICRTGEYKAIYTIRSDKEAMGVLVTSDPLCITQLENYRVFYRHQKGHSWHEQPWIHLHWPCLSDDSWGGIGQDWKHASQWGEELLKQAASLLSRYSLLHAAEKCCCHVALCDFQLWWSEKKGCVSEEGVHNFGDFAHWSWSEFIERESSVYLCVGGAF